MNRQVFILLIFAGAIIAGCGGNARNINEGDTAPDFTLEDAQGNKYTLSDYRGEKPVVLYFYPKAGTPGCTDQACGIRDEYSKFKENNIQVLGVSVDSKDALKEFISENNLNFPLLSDSDKKVSEKYGVLNNIGFASRITFIIDRNGKIAHIMRDVDVNTHARDVLELASNL